MLLTALFPLSALSSETESCTKGALPYNIDWTVPVVARLKDVKGVPVNITGSITIANGCMFRQNDIVIKGGNVASAALYPALTGGSELGVFRDYELDGNGAVNSLDVPLDQVKPSGLLFSQFNEIRVVDTASSIWFATFLLNSKDGWIGKDDCEDECQVYYPTSSYPVTTYPVTSTYPVSSTTPRTVPTTSSKSTTKTTPTVPAGIVNEAVAGKGTWIAVLLAALV